MGGLECQYSIVEAPSLHRSNHCLHCCSLQDLDPETFMVAFLGEAFNRNNPLAHGPKYQCLTVEHLCFLFPS